MHYTCFSTFSPNDFYRNLATEQAHYRKPDNFRVIQEELTRLSVEKRKTPVIIIDEANYISSAILNDFKLLFNFEMDSRDRAVVLLSGLPS
ncbi:MAG: ATP-binding protein, partial [Eubacterium sp.]|nr:ATP-binding protein [Eubacterium sp.]